MQSKNNDILDALSEVIEATINHFLDYDPHYHIAPYLSSREILRDTTFFQDNRITLSDYTASEDLKTMSYLAPFYRNRVAYNPKNIDFYLRSLGHLKYSEVGMKLICYEKALCGKEEGSISFEEWKLLP